MEKKTMGIIGLVLSAICIFIAIERSTTNANNVRAFNQMGGSLLGEMKPATPAAAKYALLFAAVFGIGGGVMIATAKSEKST